MARANPQWRDVDGEALAVFSGPHAYISPTWYEAPGTVPTWNYVAVHAYGALRLVEDRDALRDILRRTVATYERPMPAPWTYDEADPDIDRMLGAVVGFEIEIARIEGKAKLNQNHPEERRRKVIRALEARTDDDSRAIARLMAESPGG
jgi:transcriptional regulator